jgi:hypothetical protein
VSTLVLGVALSRSTNSSELTPLNSQSTAEMAILSLILISTVGLLIGWHHEVAGGLVASICGAALIAIAIASNDTRPVWLLGVAFVIPGLLYLASALWPPSGEEEGATSSHREVPHHPR